MPIGKMAALAATLIMIAAPAAADVRKGVEKWRAGDHKGAVAEWLPYAARGDADALFNLGQAYKLGRGVVRNDATALDYYRKAAARGHGPAQERLGITLYRQPATRAEGLNWLDQAARRNQPRAQYVLGIAHFNGDVLQKNWPLAYAYMLRANNAGVRQAAAALPTMNANIPLNDRLKGEEIANAMIAGTYTPQPLAVAQAAPRVMPAATVPATARPATVQAAMRPAAGPGAARPAEVVTQTATRPPSAASAGPAVAMPLGVPKAIAAPAPNPASPGGGWRVQIGAFSQQSLAAETWAGLKADQPALLAGLMPTYTQAGDMVRLQLGPFSSREDAARMCARFKAAGRGCFVLG